MSESIVPLCLISHDVATATKLQYIEITYSTQSKHTPMFQHVGKPLSHI